MLAISSQWSEFLILMGAGVVGAIILGMGKTVMGLVRTRQSKVRQEESDQRILTEFLFDTPMDPRTRTPARDGWTTKVNRQLSDLADGQTHTTQLLNEVLAQLVPDNNGGHNLRGVVERGAEAAGAALPPECKGDR